MSAPDRSWTITPTVAWFAIAIVTGIAVIDGDLSALADRLTQKREAGAARAPGFDPGPAAVAEADSDADDADTAPPLPAPPAGSHDIAALDDVCLDGTDTACKRWAMDSFYRAFAASQAGTLGRALRVSWYGDSVVATDAIPGRLRSRMQGELGDGGPGFVFVVPPHRFCEHEAITRSVGGSWKPHAVSTTQVADGFYGFGGSTVESEDDARSTIKLVSGKVTRLELYYLAHPRGGTVTIAADGNEVVRADTRADAKAPGFATATIDGGAEKFKLSAEGRVRLFGMTLENDRGAVVDNLGIVSVNVKSFTNQDAAQWTSQIEHRSSDLLMIMIGANEAQWLGPHDQDTKDYAAHYEQILAPLRKGRPDASCLVISPTDQAEAKDGGFPSRPVMPLLVAAQRKAAHAQGCAFYSTYDWMGGRGSAAKWFRKGLVSSDFQHLTRKGANKMADALFDALFAGTKQFR